MSVYWNLILTTNIAKHLTLRCALLTFLKQAVYNIQQSNCCQNLYLKRTAVWNLSEELERNCRQFWFSDFLMTTGNVVQVEHSPSRGRHNSKLFFSVLKLVRVERKWWNLYTGTAWKFKANSEGVPICGSQFPSKPICLQKELKQCYKPHIFLNKIWPGLTTRVSNCTLWSWVLVLWDSKVMKGDQGSQVSSSSVPTRLPLRQLITFSCVSSML